MNDQKEKCAWIFARDTLAVKFGNASVQIRLMTENAMNAGYTVIGSSHLTDAVYTLTGLKQMQPMFEAAEKQLISAVFVFGLQFISSNLETAFRFIDRLNRLGVVVYDNEGFDYSYDWVCEQKGKVFKGNKL